jgi:hypothetical protein
MVCLPVTALDPSAQLIDSASDSLVQGRSSVSDSDGAPTFEAGFYHAPYIIYTPLAAVYIAQVDLHSSDVIARSLERALH